MTADAADIVVFVLVDALRADYVGRTRFLQQLSSRSITGRLEEPFGFWPHAAYFGGLSVAEQGFTNLFRFDPERSVFGWTRTIARSGDGRHVRGLFRNAIVSRARAELPSWSAAYVDSFDIPLSRLASFDVCARHPAWSRQVGYRSLFHVLDDTSMPWLELSWPFEGRGRGTTSAYVTSEAIAALRPEHRFAFIHLPDLDLAGHLHGPGSIALQATLLETDRLCERIVDRALELYRDPIVVFAGDHGMLPVVSAVDVEAALAGTGLRWGCDFAYFIDSTMVRCWFFTDAARRRATAALTSIDGGHLLSAGELNRYELCGIDPRNGEAIFLADPGVVFCPSYFNWYEPQGLRGMHGYAPDVPDNRAGLLVHRPRDQSRGDVGVVAARRLYPTFLKWLGIDHRPLTTVEPLPHTAARERTRWTLRGDGAGEALVDDHVARIASVLHARAPDAQAIVLTGSFGRGEGSLTDDTPSGRPANDYDLVVVGATDAQLAGVAESLAAELGIDFVDVTRFDSLDGSGTPSQFDYDLRYGSRTLAGDPRVLDRLPLYAPAQVSEDDGALQVGNRAGGMLLALTDSFDAVDSAELFLARQTMKFHIAVADCAVIAIGDYHPSYVVRRDRFGAIARACRFSGSVAKSIDEAFSAKLGEAPLHVRGKQESALAATSALAELERSTCSRRDVESALDAGVRRRTRLGPQWVERARGHGLHATRATIDDPLSGVTAVCRACIVAVRGWADDPDACDARVQDVLAPAFVFEAARPGANLLAAVARTWLNLFH